MTLGGWIIMIISVGSVCLLFAWCLYKVLTTPDRARNLHGIENIDPKDPVP